MNKDERAFSIKFGIKELNYNSDMSIKCKACGLSLAHHSGYKCQVELHKERFPENKPFDFNAFVPPERDTP